MPGFGRAGRNGKRATIAVAVVILLVGGWVAFSRLPARFSDRYESFYPSLADAAKDGAIARGWIPDDILPSSSHNIHELHNLSPSREGCAFEFSINDSERLRKNLKSVDVLLPAVRRVRDADVSWWPAILRGDLDSETIRRQGFTLYQIERPANSAMNEILLFAVDWSTGRGFFYCTYK